MSTTMTGPEIKVGYGDVEERDDPTASEWFDNAVDQWLADAMANSHKLADWLGDMDHNPIQIGVFRFTDHIHALGWCLAHQDDRVMVSRVLKAITSQMEQQFRPVAEKAIVERAERGARRGIR